MQLRSLLLLCSTALACVACADEPGAFSGGTLQEKPAFSLETAGGLAARDPRPVLKAGYVLSVSTPNAELCKSVGALELTIYDDYSFDVPNAKIRCLQLQVDLKKVLKGVALPKNLGQSEGGKAPIGGVDFSDGKLVRVGMLNGVEFTPKRPLMVLPPLQRPDALKPFNDKKEYVASYTDADGAARETKGTIEVRVPEVSGKWSPPDAGKLKYDSILRFIMTASGFEDIDRAKTFLLDRFEMRINTNPLSLPSLKIEAKPSLLAREAIIQGDAEALGPLADAIVGMISIELTIAKEEYLK